jgi:hypothetical protein
MSSEIYNAAEAIWNYHRLERYRILFTFAACVLAGCASAPPKTYVVFPNASINGHPARLHLDTGSSSTVLFATRARRLGLNPAEISEPTPVLIAGQSFTTPLPMIRFPLAFRLAFIKVGFPADGLVGWPEIRDNILVFDADQHMIHSVAKLPPQTAGWLKLKVIPNPWLLLEIPMADGKTGTLEVDTGSVFGVEMPPEQWREWKAAHPKAHLASHLGGVGSFGLHLWQMSWADEIKLGTVTLTEVPVEDMPATQGAFIHWNAPDANAVWTIGMRALSRMDLVVDGKNGFAYVHPKPASGSTGPGLNRPGLDNVSSNTPAMRGNWVVADDVKLNSEGLFLLAGNYKHGKEDFAGALADYNRAQEINPRNADIYSRRGVIRQILGDYSGALSDYDKFIELKPDTSGWERLYRQTLWWRLGRTPDDFSQILAGYKDGWMKTLGQFLVEKLDEKTLLAAAEKSDGVPVPEQKALASYYIGELRLSKGDQAGARIWFQKCRAAGMNGDDEYHFAGAELKRLEERAKQ